MSLLRRIREVPSAARSRSRSSLPTSLQVMPTRTAPLVSEEPIVHSKRSLLTNGIYFFFFFRLFFFFSFVYRYCYTLTDKDLFEVNQVYVCGFCNYERTWLRNIEEYCTVQEFIFLLRKRIETEEEAKRLLAIGHYSSNPVQRSADQQAYLNKVLAPKKTPETSNQKKVSKITQSMREQNRKFRQAIAYKTAKKQQLP